MRAVPRTLCLFLPALSACAGGPLELTIDLRTDYAPGSEFNRVVTELTTPSFDEPGEVREALLTADTTLDFVRGVRVAGFAGLAKGRTAARVRLVDRSGVTAAERILELDLQDDFAATLVITTSCEDVPCPALGGSPREAQCQDGRCVDPRCSPSTPEYCPPPVCASDVDCPARADCDSVSCESGSCFCARTRPPADAGMDGGPDGGPPCECEPGAMESETRACGGCDSGTQRRTRTCEASCFWSAWTSFGTCMGAGCSPGDTRACPNGEPCGRQTCSSSCNWSSCQLIPGATCFRIAPGDTRPGTNYRCCGTYQWQYCLSSCDWSGACNSCLPTNCPDCG